MKTSQNKKEEMPQRAFKLHLCRIVDAPQMVPDACGIKYMT